MTAIAAVPDVVELAIAPAEWDDTVGMLSLLQRDAPLTIYFQRALALHGAFMGVDDGVGDDQPVSIMALSASDVALAAPDPQPAPVTTIPSVLTAEPQAELDAELQREGRADRRAEQEARLRAQRQARLRAERQAESQADQRAARRAERRARRAPAPQLSSWSIAPHVTWYGPGFYGNRTACGQRYTRQIIGVAHKTLPCGTIVEFRWNGITARAPVIDRGPYGPAGYIFDFSAALSCDVFKPLA